MFQTAIDDQLLLHDATTQQTHCLNPLARRVWELCDGAHDRQAMIAALAQAPGTSGRAQAAEIVDAALRSFAEQELIAVTPDLARRAASGRIGAAIAAGLVVSVVAPGRAAHASTLACPAYTDEISCMAVPTCCWQAGVCGYTP